MRKEFWVSFLVLIPLSAYVTYVITLGWIFGLLIISLFGIGVYDLFQKKHAIKSNFPILGRLRYVFEALRPKLYQYFIESDLDGRPLNRISRAVVYQRAKGQRDTVPFGTLLDVYEPGYEWINHSLHPLEYEDVDLDPRILVGGKDCLKPYNCSVFNISAMSYGSLSSRAIEALNKGAKLGKFAHNTGEGGLSPYHLKHGGDIIWQIGTGYFGARTKDGSFCETNFIKNASNETVKMIEIKLSQGAKPGHGGILPASKNNNEIAAIRGVEPRTDVISPPKHKAFNTNEEMVGFIDKLRKLSGGKPVGIKLCLGEKDEFIELCKAFKKLNSYPDYIAVDGGEGGTGAAPMEFTNSIGTPLYDGLNFVNEVLVCLGLRDQIKIFASGKAVSGFDLVKLHALGADAVYSARSMMLALGCIQALECNSNNCPTGITTHRKELTKGLDVESKSKRISSFHHHTVKAYSEILGSAGLVNGDQLKKRHLHRRLSESLVASFDEIYPKVVLD
jgi:glutamate synthase domain-containing protein 2